MGGDARAAGQLSSRPLGRSAAMSTKMQPGAVVTLSVDDHRGGEKAGSHPAVVIRDFGQTVLVVPITDAQKGRLPTHYLIPSYASGTQDKDALVTCEHARSAALSRLADRPGASPLSPTELEAVMYALRLALDLETVPTPPPAAPELSRGKFVSVDFGRGPLPEIRGRQWALVVSNDTGNYYGRHFLVAPVAEGNGVNGVRLESCPPKGRPGVLDVGLLRVVDQVRIDDPRATVAALPIDVALIDSTLWNLLS